MASIDMVDRGDYVEVYPFTHLTDLNLGDLGINQDYEEGETAVWPPEDAAPEKRRWRVDYVSRGDSIHPVPKFVTTDPNWQSITYDELDPGRTALVITRGFDLFFGGYWVQQGIYHFDMNGLPPGPYNRCEFVSQLDWDSDALLDPTDDAHLVTDWHNVTDSYTIDGYEFPAFLGDYTSSPPSPSASVTEVVDWTAQPWGQHLDNERDDGSTSAIPLRDFEGLLSGGRHGLRWHVWTDGPPTVWAHEARMNDALQTIADYDRDAILADPANAEGFVHLRLWRGGTQEITLTGSGQIEIGGSGRMAPPESRALFHRARLMRNRRG